MDIICIHCNAKHFTEERVYHRKNSFNDCCHHREVKLQSLPDPPSLLKSLFAGTHSKSTNFFQCISKFNNSFSFASFNANLINFNNQRTGPYCFKLQGQIYYQINTALYPSSHDCPTFGKLFIYDGDQAVRFRSQNNQECDIEILRELDAFMREHNVFGQSYVMMKEAIKDEKNRNNNIEPELSLTFTLKPGIDKRRYNLQKENEAAAVFSTTANGEIPESYVSVVKKDTKALQYVSSMNPNVEPWIYPLFFPFGTLGWNPNISCQTRSRRVTRNDYYKCQMAIRDEFNVFLMGRRLFQQWIIDSYVKVEKDRMNYLRNNQDQIRAESYQGLIDYLNDHVEQNNGNIGKMIILPSTFKGSPRNMVQRYQNSMSIVHKFGKPNLFITMTCNPNWRFYLYQFFSIVDIFLYFIKKKVLEESTNCLTIVMDNFTSNEEIDNVIADDRTVGLIGFIDSIENTRTVGVSKKILLKIIVSNGLGRRVRVLFWDKFAKLWAPQICDRQIIKIERARSSATDFDYLNPGDDIAAMQLTIMGYSSITLGQHV